MAGNKKRAFDNNIGRLGIQVTPDTDGFKRQLRREMKRIDSDPTVRPKIKVQWDFAGMVADLRQKIRDVERKVGEVDLEVSVNSDAVVRKARATARKIEEQIGEIEVPVGVRARDVDKMIRRVEDELAKRKFEGRKIPFDVDLSADADGLRELRRKLKDLRDDFNGEEIEFKTGLDKSATQVTRTRLAWLSRDRWVKLKPVVDLKAAQVAKQTLAALTGTRLAADMTRNLWDMVKNLDKAVPLFGALASGMAVAAGAAATLAKHTLTVGAGVAHAVQALTLLGPGFAVAGAMLTASFLVPLMKFEEHVAYVKEDFKDLANTMASGFWVSAADNFAAGYSTVFGELSAGLNRTAQSAGRHFGQVIESFSRILAPHMGKMFDHVAAGVEKLTAYSDSFAVLLRVLGKHGAYNMERFLGAMGKVTQKWAKWLSEADASGALEAMINRGLDALKAFGSVLASTAKLFSGLAKAASEAGGAPMDRLAAGLKKVAEAVNGKSFQFWFATGLKAATQTWHSFTAQLRGSVGSFFRFWVDQWRSAAKNMGESAGELVKGVLTALSGANVGKGFRLFFEDLRAGMAELGARGMWESMSNGLGALLRVMGSMARGFAPVIAETVKALSGFADRIGPSIGRIVENAGPRFASMIENWSRVLIPLSAALTRVLEAVLRIPGGVELMLAGFAGFKVISGVSTVVSTLSTALGGLGASFGAVKAGLAALTSGQGLFAAFNAARLASASTAVSGLAANVTGLGTAASTAASGGLRALAGSLANPLALAGTAFAGVLLLDIQRINDLKEAAKAAASDVGRALNSMGEGSWANRLSSSIDRAIAKLRELRPDRELRGNQTDITGFNIGVTKGDLKDTFANVFKQIADEAEINLPRAVGQLQNLHKAMKLELKDDRKGFQEWLNYLPEAISETEGLEAALNRANIALGENASSYAALNLATKGISSEFALVQAEQKRLADNASFVNSMLNAQTVEVNGLKLSFEQAGVAARIISEVGPQFVSMSEAVRGANGEVVDSVRDVVGNLVEQHKAQEQWAINIAKAAQLGISEGFLKELSKMPTGAAYLEEFLAMAESTDPAIREEFKQLCDSIGLVYPAGQEMVSGMDAVLQQLQQGTDQALLSVKQALINTFEDGGVKAKLSAATTAEEIIATLNQSGYRIVQEGNQWFAVAADGQKKVLDLTKVNAEAAGKDAAAAMATGLTASEAEVTDASKALASKVVKGIENTPADFAKIAKNAGSAAAKALRDETPNIEATAKNAATQSAQAQAAIVPTFKHNAEQAMNGWGAMILGKKPTITSNVQNVVNGARDKAAQFRPDLENIGNNAMTALRNTITNAHNNIANATRSVVTSAGNSARGAVDWSSVGSFMVQGMVNGLNWGAGWIISAARSVAYQAFEAAKSALGIHSPSRKFQELGVYSAQGFALGFDKSHSLVVSASESLADAVVGAFDGVGEAIEKNVRSGVGGVLADADRMVRKVSDSARNTGNGGGSPVRWDEESAWSHKDASAGRPIEVHQHIAVANVPDASLLAAQAADEARLLEEVMPW